MIISRRGICGLEEGPPNSPPQGPPPPPRTTRTHHPEPPQKTKQPLPALAQRLADGRPLPAALCADLEALGYASWAQRAVAAAGFGRPLEAARALLVASRHGDARDVLLAEGRFACRGGCRARGGYDCWECFRCAKLSAPPCVVLRPLPPFFGLLLYHMRPAWQYPLTSRHHHRRHNNNDPKGPRTSRCQTAARARCCATRTRSTPRRPAARSPSTASRRCPRRAARACC